jgi:hypothetical protein
MFSVVDPDPGGFGKVPNPAPQRDGSKLFDRNHITYVNMFFKVVKLVFDTYYN